MHPAAKIAKQAKYRRFAYVGRGHFPRISFLRTYQVWVVRLFKTRASLPGYATTWIASEYAMTREESILSSLLGD